MENEIYSIGSNGKIITLTVTVTTPGITTTEVKLFLANGTIINKGNSTNGAGTISERPLGIDNDLNYATVRIEAIILLSKIPETAWENCFENLALDCYLSGGVASQSVHYKLLENEKKKSSDGELIRVIKRIDFNKA